MRLFVLIAILNIVSGTQRVVVTFNSYDEAKVNYNLPFTVVKQYGRRQVLDIGKNFEEEDRLALKTLIPNLLTVELDSKLKGSDLPVKGSGWPWGDWIWVNNQWVTGPVPIPWNIEKIGAKQMWNKTFGKKGIVIAVLDSGIRQASRPAFPNIIDGYDFISSMDYATDGDARDANPEDDETFVEGQWCDGPDSHGTKVSSIINANHSTNMYGIAPGCTLLSIRVLGVCKEGLASDVSDGIIWAVGGVINGVPANSNPARIITLSLAGDGPCPSYVQSAINIAKARNAIVVVATGNDGYETYLNTYPANCDGVITVGAVDVNKNEAFFSNKGGQYLYPGVDVAVMGDNMELMFGSGTSFAVSHHVGLLALNLSISPEPCDFFCESTQFMQSQCSSTMQRVCCDR
jgi:hypothetical protein